MKMLCSKIKKGVKIQKQQILPTARTLEVSRICRPIDFPSISYHCILICYEFPYLSIYFLYTKQNTQSPEFLVEKEHSPLENDPGHGKAQIGVFRHQGAFWAEYFVFLCHMGLIIFQTPYPEKIINKVGGHECPWGAHKGRRQSSGRETWAKFKSHQIRSNGTVPSPPNHFF